MSQRGRGRHGEVIRDLGTAEGGTAAAVPGGGRGDVGRRGEGFLVVDGDGEILLRLRRERRRTRVGAVVFPCLDLDWMALLQSPVEVALRTDDLVAAGWWTWLT